MSTWKDRAIERSEAITDAWEVAKTYAGRLAEWVLFGCMVMNIVQILPGVVMPNLISNVVMGIQAVTLDVAGFGLASMADHARQRGDEQAARKGEATGWLLISLMVLTLMLVSIGLLWPVVKTYTDMAEKGLILVRVVMTVIYGHVVHGLRRSAEAYANQVAELRQQLQDAQREHGQAQAEQAATIQELQDQLTAMQAAQSVLQDTANDQADAVQTLQMRLQSAERETAHLTATLAQRGREMQSKEADLQTALQSLDTAKSEITRLQLAVQEARKMQTAKPVKAPEKTAKVVQFAEVQSRHETAKKPVLTHAEVWEWLCKHPALTRAEQAAKLQISERKVYDAVAWAKSQGLQSAAR